MASRVPVDAPEGTAARPLTPDSSSTSASTVGLPRESRISRATMSTIELILLPSWCSACWLAGRFCPQRVLGKGALLDQFIQRLEGFQQWLHQMQRPGVGSV